MDGHRASSYVQPPPGSLVPFLSPLFLQHHIWTAPTACNSNNSWNPHERFKSKKSVEILPSFDVGVFWWKLLQKKQLRTKDWTAQNQIKRTKISETNSAQLVQTEMLDDKRNNFFRNFFPKTTKQWSEGKSSRISMKTEVSSHLWYVLKQSLHSFSNQNYAKTRQLKYSWKPSQNPRNADRSRILIGQDCNKTKYGMLSLLWCVLW